MANFQPSHKDATDFIRDPQTQISGNAKEGENEKL